MHGSPTTIPLQERVLLESLAQGKRIDKNRTRTRLTAGRFSSRSSPLSLHKNRCARVPARGCHVRRCLEESGDDLAAALPLYSRLRAPEAKNLVELSRGFDRTGVAGFFGFILPLILDSVFHGALPRVFAPNTIAFLQKEGVTFRHIRMRKALDRVMQGAVLGAVGFAAFSAVRVGVGALAPLVVSALAGIR